MKAVIDEKHPELKEEFWVDKIIKLPNMWQTIVEQKGKYCFIKEFGGGVIHKRNDIFGCPIEILFF